VNGHAQAVLLGAIASLCFVAALFFLKYWRSTRDRFFLFLVAAFTMEGLNRFVAGWTGAWSEDSAAQYLVRLASYGLIVIAIIDKNRPGR
jgi:hypothetical protein